MNVAYSTIMAYKSSLEDALRTSRIAMDAVCNIVYWYEFESTRISNDEDHEAENPVEKIGEEFHELAKEYLVKMVKAAETAKQESKGGSNA